MLTLLNPLFLLGAATAAIPLVLHLLHRRRAKPVEWPSLKFLKTVEKRTARRKRIEDLLLMILRMGLLAALSMALARPFLKGAGALSSKAPAAAVIVLDNSYSMSAESNGVTRYAAAKEAALSVLQSMRSTDFTALIFSDGATPPALRTPAPGPQRVADAVRASEVSALSGSIGARVAEALALVSAQESPNREVYVVTDLQSRGWRSTAEELARAAGAGRKPVVAVIDCSAAPEPNCSVDDIVLRAAGPLPGEPIVIEAKVANRSGAPLVRRVVLSVDGEPRAEQSVSLAAGAAASVAFTHSFEKPGAHTGRVEIGEDALKLDNRRFFAWRVVPRLDVLIVEGRASAIPEGRASYYLVSALTAGRSGKLEESSPLRPGVIDSDSPRLQDIGDYDAVFLLGPPEMTAELASRLRRYVESGGCLVIAPGEGFDAEGVARELGERASTAGREAAASILPATCGPVEGTALGPVICRLADADGEHPVTRALKEVDRSALGSVLIRKRWRLDVEYGSPGSPLLKSDDGATLLAAATFGRGRVLLAGIPLDASWSNLPKRGNVYVPLVRSIVYHASRRGGETEVLAGSLLPLEGLVPPELALPVEATVTDPSGTALAVRIPTPEGDKPYPPAVQPGLYEIDFRGAPDDLAACAVNVDPAESDAARLEQREIQRLLGGASSEFFYARDPVGVREMISRIREGVKLWDSILAAALVAAVFECFFSNRILPSGRAQLEGQEAAAGTEASPHAKEEG